MSRTFATPAERRAAAVCMSTVLGAVRESAGVLPWDAREVLREEALRVMWAAWDAGEDEPAAPALALVAERTSADEQLSLDGAG